MVRNAIIQARIDEETKVRAQKILNALHISMSEAISMYLRQIVFHRGIPFDLRIPNEVTAKTLRESEEGKGLHEVGSVDELFEELDK